jgi:hypothetical protein
MSVWKISSPESGGYLVDKLRDVDINVKPLYNINFNNQEDYQVCLLQSEDSEIKICRTIDLKTFRVFETDLDVGATGCVLLSSTKIVSLVYGASGVDSIRTFVII